VHVVARNDAPTFTAAGELAPVLAGNANPPGQKIFAIFNDEFQDPDIGDTLAGIAVVGNAADPATEGTWQYTTDNGGTWFDIGAVADGPTALALSATTRIRFLPAGTFSGRPTPLIVRPIDSTFTSAFTDAANRQTVDSSANGGTTSIGGSTSTIETQVFPAGTGGITPPILSGVPVSANIDEGQTLAFTASAADPNVGQTVAFSLVGAPTGASIDPGTGVFTWTPTEAQGPDTFVFLVRASDGLANTDQQVTVIVREVNTAPTLGSVPTNVLTVRGRPVTFTATATDPDLVNGLPNALTYSLVGAPDGAVIDPDTGDFAWTPGESLSAGVYSFTVRVVDDGVPARSDTKPVSITVADAAVIGGNLVVAGTGGRDTIAVTPSRDGTQLTVVMNRVKFGPFAVPAGGGRIVMSGLGGADRITVDRKITVGADLYGNAGNDTLTGGSGNDLLVGGDGNDVLTGRAGTNVLIGGAGADRLTGGSGDDLLLGGPTAFDLDPTGLANIAAEWTSGASYLDRINHLSTVLTPATVADDHARDVLTGGAGLDWFVASALDLYRPASGEQALTI
jgi:Ca2+-binding RTX toxin-like protein